MTVLCKEPILPKDFSPGTLGFPSPTFPNSNTTRNQVDEETLCGCATSKSLFIYLFINRNPYDFSDSDSDFDEEEDDKKTKKKKKKKVSRGDGFGLLFSFLPRCYFLLLILETPERQDHNYKVFHFIEVLHKTQVIFCLDLDK